MRVLLIVTLVALSGCVTELLAPPSVTARTLACATLDPEYGVELFHHLAPSLPVASATIDDASIAWMVQMAAIGEKSNALFSTNFDVAPPDLDALDVWHEDQAFLSGRQATIHVLWLTGGLDEAAQVLLPGVVAINVSMIQAAVEDGHDVETVTRALLFHGLGHALGVVNMGIPLHDPTGPMREKVAGHESSPRSVMFSGWHDAATFPSGNATYHSYSAGITMDWKNAYHGRVCA